MKDTMRTLIVALLLFGVERSFGATLSTLPSDGSVFGHPGETVGWGYSIENDTSSWLVPMGLSANGILFGSLTDVYDYGVVAPLSTATIPYQFASPGGAGFSSGLFEYLIPGATPTGLTQSGSFILQYQFFSDNPDINSFAVPIGPILSFPEQAFSVTTFDAVPEPTSGGLLLMSILIGKLCLKRRSRWTS